MGVRYYQSPPKTIQKSTHKNILFQKEKMEKKDKNLSFNKALHTEQGLFLFACGSRLNQEKKAQKMLINKQCHLVKTLRGGKGSIFREESKLLPFL